MKNQLQFLLTLVGILLIGNLYAQSIDSVFLQKDVSPMLISEDTICDYNLDVTLNSLSAIHHIHMVIQSDSVFGAMIEFEFLQSDLHQYEVSTLKYLFPFGPLDISLFDKWSIRIVNDSEVVVEEIENRL